MDCVVLGNGGMMPMPARLTTSLLVRKNGRMILFDAGEGIQLALKRGALGIRGLDAAVISHLHADHTLGLPGIMMFRAQNESPGPFTIIGPPGIKRFICNTIDVLGCRINYEFDVIEWAPEASEIAWHWHGDRLIWAPLCHSTFCLGYRLEEPMRPGKFLLDKALALNIPPGPLYRRLQTGETVTLDNGQTVSPNEVSGPPRPGRIVTFATDTRPCEGLHRVLKNADIAFVEGMFTSEHRAEAAQKKHMTAEEAALAVKEARAKRAVLVHISPRYSREDERILESEAEKICPRVEMSKPLCAYAVPLQNEEPAG